jgi:hypothetical protein
MRKTVFVILATALVPFCAFAVDGVVLINQSTLNGAGGTYTITQSGSYKLSGNLQAKDANTSVIAIAQSHVTIVLNGFSILGPADCSGGFPCANTGNGTGIITTPNNQNYFNITIRNGTIQGMGNRGIQLVGDSFLVEYMHIRSNGGRGIEVGGTGIFSRNHIVQHNNVQQNGSHGIIASAGRVADNGRLREQWRWNIFCRKESGSITILHSTQTLV